MRLMRRRRDLDNDTKRRLSKTKQPIADVDNNHPHGAKNRTRNATGETTPTMMMTTTCHGGGSTEPNADCHHPHLTTMISPHRIISLGMGVVSKHTGLVEQFVPTGIMNCSLLLTMRRGDTFPLLEEEEITGTSSSLSDISAEDDNNAIGLPAAQKQLKTTTARSFLRTADLGEPRLQQADEEDKEDNWIALDNGMGGPSPLAQQTVQALFEHGRCILSRSDLWTAADAKTQKLTTAGIDDDDDWKTTTFQDCSNGGDVVVDDLYDDTVLIWSGKFDEACYGHDIPAIRSAALIHGMSALDLLELLVDSGRVQEYNALSLGRTDDLVLVDDDNTNNNNHAEADGKNNGGFGLCTKLMTSQTKPPLIRKILTFTSLLHARQDGEHTGTYYLITRGVTRSNSSAAVETAATSLSGGSEILLGVNRIQHVADDCCLLTSVNHIKSSLVPMMIAKRIGLQAAVNFVHDLRKVAAASTASAV